MGFLNQNVIVYRLLTDKKSPDILFWPGGVFVYVQAKAAGKLVKEIPDTRTGLDGLVASGFASCLIIGNGYPCQGIT